jgi:hypothetical protein
MARSRHLYTDYTTVEKWIIIPELLEPSLGPNQIDQRGMHTEEGVFAIGNSVPLKFTLRFSTCSN